MERAWNAHPSQRQFADIAFVGLEWRGLESGSGCAFTLVPDQSY